MASGYHDCPCRDCFEIAIGEDKDGSDSLCSDCEEAGCDASGQGECESPDAYGQAEQDQKVSPYHKL